MTGWRREMLCSATPAGRGSPPRPICRGSRASSSIPAWCWWRGPTFRKEAGTTTPFEMVGAPFVDPLRAGRRTLRVGLPGRRLSAFNVRAHVSEMARRNSRRCVPARSRRPRFSSPIARPSCSSACIRQLCPRLSSGLNRPTNTRPRRCRSTSSAAGRELREGLADGITPQLVDELTRRTRTSGGRKSPLISYTNKAAAPRTPGRSIASPRLAAARPAVWPCGWALLRFVGELTVPAR